MLSYPRKRLPFEGIERATTIKYTHESLTIDPLCHDITVTLYSYIDFVVPLHVIFDFQLLDILPIKFN
jgi:hypothetical protein